MTEPSAPRPLALLAHEPRARVPHKSRIIGKTQSSASLTAVSAPQSAMPPPRHSRLRMGSILWYGIFDRLHFARLRSGIGATADMPGQATLPAHDVNVRSV
jgi:hypothetical protein